MNDCANVKEALRKLEKEGIPLTVAGDCKRHRTTALVEVRLGERLKSMASDLLNGGFIGLCNDVRQGDDSRVLILRPTQIEHEGLKTTLVELADQNALSFSEDAVCCICFSGASTVSQMVAAPGLVAGVEIAICGDCIGRGLAAKDVVDSKAVLAKFPRPGPAPVMRCDFCNAGLAETNYLLTSDEAYVCDNCLRSCGESLGSVETQ